MLPELDLTLPTALGVATYPAGASFGPRLLRDWEFVWIIEGDAEYRWNSRTVAAPAGTILLCRPEATDFFRWDPHRRTRHGFFHFGLRILPADWPPPDQWPLARLPEGSDILRPLFQYVLTWGGSRASETCCLAMASLLAAFVSGQAATGEVPREPLPDAVERTWTFLQAQFEADPAASISLTALAEAACVSPEYLCRLFKAATGHSPAEVVRLARLDHAATLLARSNYSIAQIAAFCGFASPFHFSRRFREAFGRTPSAVRQAVQSGAMPPLPRLLHVMSLASSSEMSISDRD